MTTRLKQIRGGELVEKILSGERDFSGIELEEGFDLSGYEDFERMQNYLRGQNLADSPVIINGSQFKYVKAAGLYLPHVRGERVDLRGAYLGGADLREAYLREAYLREADLRRAYLGGAYLRGADLEGAYLRGADLREADLGGADLRGADLRRADLEGADLRGANLWGADLREADLGGADLKNVKNLMDAKNLEYAIFMNTRVTEVEQKIIKEAIKKRKLFVVEE